MAKNPKQEAYEEARRRAHLIIRSYHPRNWNSFLFAARAGLKNCSYYDYPFYAKLVEILEKEV